MLNLRGKNGHGRQDSQAREEGSMEDDRQILALVSNSPRGEAGEDGALVKTPQEVEVEQTRRVRWLERSHFNVLQAPCQLQPSSLLDSHLSPLFSCSFLDVQYLFSILGMQESSLIFY